jgi:hypothetical protein
LFSFLWRGLDGGGGSWKWLGRPKWKAKRRPGHKARNINELKWKNQSRWDWNSRKKRAMKVGSHFSHFSLRQLYR